MLLAVPNVSEGRDPAAVAAIGAAFGAAADVRLLDTHVDPDHHRAVFTLAGPAPALPDAVLAGARAALERIELAGHRGEHPRVGALDVAPIVYLDAADRGAACAAALVTGDLLARELGLPVFLYGLLAHGRTRAQLRRGGAAELARRVADGELMPDFGPRRLHPSAGATLVAARPPLIAFNVELAPPATLEHARAIAGDIRAGGAHGLPGVRALGLRLASGGAVQVSTNVEDHRATPLAAVVRAVRRHAAVARTELVGLAPRAALEGFPADVPITGFDPDRHVVENALASGSRR